jgi:hypothetical protein
MTPAQTMKVQSPGRPSHEVIVMNARLTGVIASLTVFAACAGDDSVDLGNGPIERATIELVEFSGSWDGYAEGYRFRDGSDRVRLMIDANGNGVLEVGDSAPRPVPAANSGYDPATTSLEDVNPGFSYPITGANVANNRLQAGSDHLRFFEDYCEQLAPVATSGGFACRPDESYVTNGDGTCTLVASGSPVSCELLYCDSTCACDAQSCRVKTREEAVGRASTSPDGKSIHLDAALEDSGQKLVGTLVLEGFAATTAQRPDATRIAVRMTRN